MFFYIFCRFEKFSKSLCDGGLLLFYVNYCRHLTRVFSSIILTAVHVLIDSDDKSFFSGSQKILITHSALLRNFCNFYPKKSFQSQLISFSYEKNIFQILLKSRCHILVTFPTHLKKKIFLLQKFSLMKKNTTKQVFSSNFGVEKL